MLLELNDEQVRLAIAQYAEELLNQNLKLKADYEKGVCFFGHDGLEISVPCVRVEFTGGNDK